jgi:hypothetical protein
MSSFFLVDTGSERETIKNLSVSRLLISYGPMGHYALKFTYCKKLSRNVRLTNYAF